VIREYSCAKSVNAMVDISINGYICLSTLECLLAKAAGITSNCSFFFGIMTTHKKLDD
jgi:hypothetical protein